MMHNVTSYLFVKRYGYSRHIVEQPQAQSQSQSQSSNNNNENNNNNALSQSQETKIYICNEGGCKVQ
ncbi:MAG: hypothetical protein ACRD8W_01415 [Nitrososphaeraceae archaeon]